MSQDLIRKPPSPLDPPSVPFWIEVYEGLGKTEGLIRYKHPDLILEFKTKDSLFGVLTSRLKEISLGLSSITAMYLKSNIFRTKIVLKTSTLQSLDALPGSQTGTIEMRVKRANRYEAAELISHVSLRLSEYRLQQLDDEIDPISE